MLIDITWTFYNIFHNICNNQPNHCKTYVSEVLNNKKNFSLIIHAQMSYGVSMIHEWNWSMVEMYHVDMHISLNCLMDAQFRKKTIHPMSFLYDTPPKAPTI